MSNVYCDFIDVGYLRAQGSRACVDWPQTSVPSPVVGFAGLRFLRASWYDGMLEPQHADSPDQRRVFDGIAFTPGVPLRLGD